MLLANSQHATILPAMVLVTLIAWNLDREITQGRLGMFCVLLGVLLIQAMYRSNLDRDELCQLRSYIFLYIYIYTQVIQVLSALSGVISGKYWWPFWKRDVLWAILSCSVCATTKSASHLPIRKLMCPYRIGCGLTLQWTLSWICQFWGDTLWVIIDRFSKGCHFVPFNSLHSALQVAESLFQYVFRYYGIPEDILSDRGPQFVPRVWRAFMTHLEASVLLTSGYHPQSNGQAERTIQELDMFLRAYCHSCQNDWFRLAYPFECVLGHQPLLCPWDRESSEVPGVDGWFRSAERVWEGSHMSMRQAICRFQN